MRIVTSSIARRPLVTLTGPALAILALVSATALGAQTPETPSGQARLTAAGMPGPEYQHEFAPTATAIPVSGSIDIDGRLEDATWAAATPITDFIQQVPLEGEPGTQRTEVRLAYDDNALYVGVMMYDDGPVSGVMARRDIGRGNFDFFQLSLDSFHDHETTYDFFINPTGTFRDAVGGGGGGGGDGGGRGGGGSDASWDPVWTRATQVTAEGWSLEMRIPFSQLRFSRAEEQVWGIRFQRTIYRTQERTIFPFVPTLDRGGASRYGHLQGITGIEPGQRLELLPYVAARGEYLNLSDGGVNFPNPYRSGSDHFADVGLDLKYRLAANVTLDATVNPDFGQVALDPSVVNLTAFETRFQEVRPFFVEGADIFNFGEGGPAGSTGRPPQLLYSRRIGRAPQGPVPSQAIFDDHATSTTILGAAKVTGRTQGGWSLGLLEAVTDEESAKFVDASQVPGEAVVEPRTNYLVGRLRRQFGGGETRIGVLGSAVNRGLSGTGMEDRLHTSAYSGGLDFAHEWSNRTYVISSAITGSYVSGSPGAITRTQATSTRYYQRPDASHLDFDPTATSLAGYYAMVDVGKQAGAFTARTAVALASPGYEVNDLGFQSASDRVILDTNFQYSQPSPGRFLRNWSVRGSPDASWNYAGDRVQGEINGNFNVQLLNYWGGGVRLAYNPVNDDDRLTRGGPIAKTPTRFSQSVNFSSDSRRALVGRLNYNHGTTSDGGWDHGVGLNLSITAGEAVDLQFSPNFSRRKETAQYVSAQIDTLATPTFGRRYIFADLDQTTFSLATRVAVTLSPALSLQLYAEPFISSGDYSGLKEFAQPGTFDFLRYGDDIGTISQQPNGTFAVDPDGAGPAAQFNVGNRDFSYRSLLGNAVLRWEWREGSTIFLVWQQRRISSLSNLGPNGTDPWVGDFDLGRDVGDMFGTPADNIFGIKVNYWLNP
ncbi:MAG: carbohydrate binding family 9 domain-containing protein [Gemmatimonadota bacterium]|nr:carbohydrate binding family 9 domain-containing protein [Gemmatimonadota bacterium]